MRLIAVIGFIGTGLGLISGRSWRPAMAVAASIISLVVIVPWWNTIPPEARVGAVFKLLVIIALVLPVKDKILDLV